MVDDKVNGFDGANLLLWPDRPASSEPEISFRSPPMLGPETAMLRNVSAPSLTVFTPDPGKANGIGIIICPGGGWGVLAWEKEGIDPARWLASRGYTAFLLKYRLQPTPSDQAEFFTAIGELAALAPAPVPPVNAPRKLAKAVPFPGIAAAREAAAEDGRRAVEIIRSQAAALGIHPDRIGMLGFSAGAFLAVDVAVEPKAGPLAFVAAIYGGETDGRKLPADAPPLFAVVAQDDRAFFRIVEALYADWTDAERPAELHIFSRGGHGFGVGAPGQPVARWTDLLADWLAEHGLA